MQHFPIFLDLAGRRVVVSGGGDAALAKLRLLLKTEARITVFAARPDRRIITWAAEGALALVPRAMEPGDAVCAVLFYGANEDADEDARTAALARAEGALVNVVDNLQDSQFITPAIVDRDPVTVAIGTEGAAPGLARIGKSFRKMAEALPFGRARRDFWQDYYFNAGPRAITQGEEAVDQTLDDLLARHLEREQRPGHISFVGAGPGDPDLLTLKARKALDAADVVIHDRLVPQPILELARREATMIDVGKTGFGPSTRQEDIDALIVKHGLEGAQVVRLKGGDCTVFGRLDEEIEAVLAAGLSYDVVPGITAASAAVAAIGQSITKRGRNASARVMTGHDMQGFADHDWRSLAQSGEVAAIYMGKRAAHFLQGRLMMHGAAPDTPVTVVENASRPDQRVLDTRLDRLSTDIAEAGFDGPALMLYGLAPRDGLPVTNFDQEASPWPANSHPKSSPQTPSSLATSSI